MVFSPPDAADVWQHKKDSETPTARSLFSRLPKRKSRVQAQDQSQSQANTAAQDSRPLSSSTSQAVDKGKAVDQGMPAQAEASGSAPPEEIELEQAGEASKTNKQKKPKMSNGLKENVWAGRNKDGQDRSHIPPMSMTMLRLRIAQLSLAVVFLILASFAAFTLNMGNLTGFGLSFFTFSWTVLYFAWLGASILFYPIIYHWIAHIVVEGLTNIFWLASWATLASYASALNLAGAGRAVGVAGLARRAPPAPPGPGGPLASTGVLLAAPAAGPIAGPGAAAASGAPSPPTPPLAAGAGAAANGIAAAAVATPSAAATIATPAAPAGPAAQVPAAATPGSPAAVLAQNSASTVQAAEISIGVDAGLGAVIWVLFIVTAIMTVLAILRHLKQRKGGNGKDPEAGPAYV